MKIYFLSHRFYPDVGGIESNSKLLAGVFTAAGHMVRLVTWTQAAVEEENQPYQIMRQPTTNQLVQEYRWADVVFENNPCLRLAWPNLFIGKPYVVALNTWITRVDGSAGVHEKVKYWWLSRAKNIIAVSEALRRRCWPAATVIPNPFEAQLFRIQPDCRREYDFAFLGRLVSTKGADQALAALTQLTIDAEQQSVAKPTLTIIGDGPELEPLRQQASRFGVEQQVRFTGTLRGEELVSCLNQHRFLLVPSVWEEPFGNVVLEGMACGCVPLASNGGGLPDAVGNAGLLFARNDMEALLSCIRYILRRPELEQQLREAAPAHLAAHRPALVARQYLDVLESAVSAGR